MPRLRTFCAVAIGLTASAASAATIPLRAGDYGVDYLACDNQPNAVIMSFDGRAFAYAHLTKCTDTIIGTSTSILHIEETCRAIGDGIPRTPFTQAFGLRLGDREHFTLVGTRYSARYRRCGDPTFFDRH